MDRTYFFRGHFAISMDLCSYVVEICHGSYILLVEISRDSTIRCKVLKGSVMAISWEMLSVFPKFPILKLPPY